MKSIWTIYKKEMKEYFYSSIAYIFLAIFIIIPNILFFHFFGGIFKENLATMRIYFMMLPYIFIIFIPGLTMGSWSKEKNNGTTELLFTFPLKEYTLIIGKFLASLSLVFIALASTVFIPLLTNIFLGSFDWGQLFSEYFGALLLASAYIAISFFVSSLTKELIDSFLISSAVLLVITILGYLPNVVSFPIAFEWVKGFLVWVSFSSRFENFSKGVLDSKDIIYFIGFAFVFFYLNLKSIESRKWS